MARGLWLKDRAADNKGGNTMGIHQVWRALSVDARSGASSELAALRASPGWPVGVQDAFAKAIGFRPKRIGKMPADALALLLAQHLGRLPSKHLVPLLKHLHTEGRKPLLSRVYDALGVEHEEADVSDECLARGLDEATAIAGIEALNAGDEQDSGQLEFCLAVMARVTSLEWQPVVDRLYQRLVELRTESEVSTVAAQDGEAADPAMSAVDEPVPCPVVEDKPGAEPDEVERPAEDTDVARPARRPAADPNAVFTSLDRLLIDAAVASVTGAESSLDPDKLDDLVQEVINLNPKRKRSSFHRGFVDALHDEDKAPWTTGDNNESRAWYLTGFIQGQQRRGLTPEAVSELIESEVTGTDREVLLGHDLAPGSRAAGSVLAGSVIIPMLEADAVDQVQPWLNAYLPAVAKSVLPPLLAWAKERLVNHDPEPIRLVLETVRRLRAKIERIHGPLPVQTDHDLRRRLAVCWRRAGQMIQAEQAVMALLSEDLTAYERGRLLGDRALIAMGVRAIENLELPPPDRREAFLKAIAAQREVLEEAVADDQSVPSALVALALPAVANSGAAAAERTEAAERLRSALAAMNDEAPEFWSSTGLMRRCRFYLVVLELREADQALVSPAVTTLLQMLKKGDDFAEDLPNDLIEEAMVDAVLVEARSSREVAQLALQRRPHQMLKRLDLANLAEVGQESRQGVLDALGRASEQLSVAERWTAWRELLRGSLAGEDHGLGAAERALDALEELAERHDREDEFLKLLSDEKSWSPAWDLEDVLDARVRLLLNLGRNQEVVATFSKLVHKSITENDGSAEGLIERLEEIGADEAMLHELRLRLTAEQRKAASTDAAESLAEQTDPEPVSVLFVGGNETQANYEDWLARWFAESFSDCELVFRFPGWGSNWGRTTDELESRLGEANVLVLMKLVRTGLGRTMRRAASEQKKPWVACAGRGRASLQQSIAAAVARARRPRLVGGAL